jgi:hypothetical protein
MKYILSFILACFFGVSSVFAYQVGNGAWLTVYRSDGYYYRIYNGCGQAIFAPENYSSDFYRATTSNIRNSCIRVHKVIYPSPGITACPSGSTVLGNDYWTRLSLNTSVQLSGSEMRCDFLP